ncbi:MAG: ATP cone domain-containing protein [Ruminococcus sp.]|nr:ATP cone domain-containing protein [Ruminococcus sp.]
MKENNNLMSDLVVIKRSGQRVPFNDTKIALAIKKSFDKVYLDKNSEKQINKVYEDVLSFIKESYTDRKTINVEDIQDIIEEKLQSNKYHEVYKAFNDYRVRRAASRKAFSLKQQHKFVKAIERITDENNLAKKENASPSDILLDYGKTIACEYTKTYILDNKLVQAHEEGSIYIHNLDYFYLGKISDTHIILNNRVKEDFSRNFIFEVLKAKEEIDGEIAIDALDKELSSSLTLNFRKHFKEILTNYLKVTDYLDYINIKRIEKIIEKDLNVEFDIDLFSPFILNDKVKKIFINAYNDALNESKLELTSLLEDLIVNLNNNNEENARYSISLGTNISKEGSIINECYLNLIETLEYTNNVVTIFKINEQVSLELLNKASKLVVDGKNISFAFPSASYNTDKFMDVEYFGSGKRLFENTVYEEKGSTGRMIVSSVSINMGRLGFKYEDKNLTEFYQELDELLEMAKNCLVNIFETIGDKNKDNYRVIFNGNILDDDKLEYGQKIRKILKRGVLNLELVGISECVLNLEKNPDKRNKLFLEILKYIRAKCEQYSMDTKLNFMVSETNKIRPLRKLMALDKAIYGIKKDITDKEYYGRIDSLFKFKENIHEDLKNIGKCQEILNGGNYVEIILNKNTTIKEILNIIKIAGSSNVGFIRLEIRK